MRIGAVLDDDGVGVGVVIDCGRLCHGIGQRREGRQFGAVVGVEAGRGDVEGHCWLEERRQLARLVGNERDRGGLWIDHGRRQVALPAHEGVAVGGGRRERRGRADGVEAVGVFRRYRDEAARVGRRGDAHAFKCEVPFQALEVRVGVDQFISGRLAQQRLIESAAVNAVALPSRADVPEAFRVIVPETRDRAGVGVAAHKPLVEPVGRSGDPVAGGAADNLQRWGGGGHDRTVFAEGAVRQHVRVRCRDPVRRAEHRAKAHLVEHAWKVVAIHRPAASQSHFAAEAHPRISPCAVLETVHV